MATLDLSVAVRNRLLDAIETEVGTTPLFELRAGAMPANCAAASTGAILVSQLLPSDWLAAASGGTKSKAGTWTFTGIGAGTIGYFRIYKVGSPSECDIQGDVTATGGGGAMEVDNTSIAVSQAGEVTAFTLTGPNA